MIPQDFYGKKQYIWWIGVVEDVKDELKLGRLRVRIFGIHSDDKTKVPTTQLPWAQVLLPTTGAMTTSGPREGDWVQGFFQDSEQAQVPIVTGVYGGIQSKQAQIIYEEAVVRSGGTSSHPTSTSVDRPLGQPTTAPEARGVIQGSLIDKTNNTLAHVCDFVSEAQKNLKLREFMKMIMSKIRDAIEGLALALGFGDVTGEVSWAITLMKKIKSALEWFNKKILKPIQDFQKYVLAYIVKMRQIIQWILSLPAQFLAMLQDCLNRVLSLIGKIFTDTIAGSQEGLSGFNSGGEFTELINNAKEVRDQASQLASSTMNIVTNTFAIAEGVTIGMLSPVSQADITAANNYINQYESSSSNTNTLPAPNEGKERP